MADTTKRKPGRPKGSVNRRKLAELERLKERSQMTPLDFLVAVYHNDYKKVRCRKNTLTVDIRLDAAKAAAPYIHSRMAQKVEVDHKVDYARELKGAEQRALQHINGTTQIIDVEVTEDDD